MMNIPEEKVYERWDTLPPTLKQALTSEVNSDFIWKTCESEHIPDEKIYFVGRAVSHVLLGFIHPGDLAQELKESLNLNPQITTSIANAINERIFKPLSADLDKIYEPPSALTPKSVIEIKPFGAAPSSAKATAGEQGRPPAPPAPKIEGLKPPAVSGFDKLTTGRVEPFEIKVTDASPFSKPIGEIKPFTPSPSTSLGAGRVEVPLPATPTPSTPSPFRFGVPPAPSIIKPEIKTPEPFDSAPASAEASAGRQSKPPVPSIVVQPSSPQIEAPPTILHEEMSTSPSKSAQGFKIEIPTPKFSEIKLNLPAKPAVLEFGQAPPPAPPAAPARRSLDEGGSRFEPSRIESKKSEEEKVRVVHYTELRTPLIKPSDKIPTSPAAQKIISPDREIKEITMEAPKLLTPTHIEPPPTSKPPIPPEVITNNANDSKR